MAETKTPPPALRRLFESLAREISPGWIARREGARLRAARLSAARDLIDEHRSRRARRHMLDDFEVRRFDAATNTPRTQGWLAPLTGPDAALGPFLDRLRQRSRDLSRNNPWAAKAKRAIPSHMVGCGLRASWSAKDPAVADRAQEAWDEWADSTDCDADGRTNLGGLQGLSVGETVEAGEVLVRMRLRRMSDGLAVPLQLQVLEADHLDASMDNLVGVPTRAGERRRRQGVEFDARGKRVGYWLFPEHPAFGLTSPGNSVFIPAETVAHVYRLERAGQVRGIPWGAPCLLTIRDLGDWADATMLRVKLAACFAAFIETDGDMDDPDSVGASVTGKDVEDLEPGMVEYLRPGQKVSFTDPPGVEGMDEFPKLALRAIAVGFGVPSHVLTGDLHDVNFSSARIGNLDFDAELDDGREKMLVPQLLAPVARVWKDQAIRAGVLPDDPTLRCSWTPPPRALIDPKADLEASKARIRNGVSTLSEEQRRFGWRPSELLAEQAKDWETVDKLKLAFDSDPRRAEAGSPGGNAPADGGADKPGETPPPKPDEKKAAK